MTAADASQGLEALPLPPSFTRDATALIFVLNKKKVTLQSGRFDPDLTLLEYLRQVQGLTGTKLGCAEGGCGACTVVVGKVIDGAKAGGYEYRAVNACLLPLVAVHGAHVLTVEGIGTSQNPHPIQERIAKMFGSQCGFCTPGIVMSLYATVRTAHSQAVDLTEAAIEASLDGNLCRCTGYRPILDAAKTFATKHVSAYSTSSSSSSASASTAVTTPEEEEQKDLMRGANVCAKGKDCCRANGAKDACQGSSSEREIRLPTTAQDVATLGYKPYAVADEIIFPPSLLKVGMAFDQQDLAFPSPAPPDYYFEEESTEEPERRTLWLRPGSLVSLVEAMSFYSKLGGAAKLRSGNTETGIEVKFKHALWSVNLFVSEHLSELAHLETGAELKIGVNLSLQTFLQQLRENIAASSESDASYALQLRKAIVSNLKYFAGTQIRNVATLAGNIATASPISDLNPIWLAADASVAWVDTAAGGKLSGCKMRDFFKGYRKTALPPYAILTELTVPDCPGYIRAYKQAKRKDDDIAIVNAGLYVDLASGGKVRDICLAYGGMAPTTTIAQHAVAFLKGKQWGDEAILNEAMSILAEKDFDLAYTVPGGMAAFRKALALGFFARFWADTSAVHGIKSVQDPHRLAELPYSEPLRHVLTSGKQELEGVELSAPAKVSVGKAVPHLAALKQVTGEAIYVDDMPPVANETFAGLVMSPKAHAKILSIDKSPALKIPGVIEVVTIDDIPKGGSNIWSPPAMDEPFFADGEVHAVGQIIAVVVAHDKRTAQRAAKAVKIEYEDLPHILTIDEAIAAESYFKPRPVLRKGDVEADWSQCERILEGETRMGGQEHFYLETNACLVIPGREDSEIEIFSSTQNPSETQAFAASILGVPANRVVCRTKRLGGGFGGKESRTVAIAGVLCVAAAKTSRPVRIMLDRDEDMMFSGQRHPFKAKWKVGFTKEGRLLRLDAQLYNNGGWSQDLSQAVLERAMTHIDNCCYFPTLKVEGKVCRTNTMSNTAFRGFGGPQGMFINQDMLTKVAASLDMSTEDLIELNMYKEGQRTHYNQELVDWNVPKLWSEVKASSDYEQRKAAVEAFNKDNRWKKRGISLVPTKFGISYTALFLNQAFALIHIYHHDGSILLSHGGTEMGQGLHTKMAQIAAEELGVPLDLVHIVETNTQMAANTSPTAASASSDLNGMAVKDACRQLNEAMAPFRKDVSWAKACHDAYFARAKLSAVGHYKTPDIGFNWATGEGKPFFYYTQGVAVSEVEVDTLTGDSVILRADIHMDIGRSINPGIDIGQIEGAFTQGFGLTTMEESLWLPNGRPFNNGPGNLKIPAFLNTPYDFRVSFLKSERRKQHHLQTIQTSKGVGEPPLFMGCTVFFAIRNAIVSARIDAGQPDDGVNFQMFSPATPERIRTSTIDQIVTLATKGTEPKSANDKPFFLPIY